jgi:hypothetical protein
MVLGVSHYPDPKSCVCALTETQDKPYEMMTVSDFHTNLYNKVDGTWNLRVASSN